MVYILTYLASVLLTANSFCILLHVNGSSDTTRISDLSATIDYRDVVEGGNVTVVCNVTSKCRVYWTRNDRAFSDGRTLSITNITRNLFGLYMCIAYNTTYIDETGQPHLQEEVYTLFLNVIYPAKILSVNISSTKVPLHDDFRMKVKVEGSPLPTTTFKSLNDGRTWFLQKKQQGTFNISIPSVNCTNTGQYLLSCKPGPDPRFPLNTKYTPRLGKTVTLTMHARGYPIPEYYWSHNGAQVNSSDDKYNSTVVILEVSVNNFGTYTLNITNVAGTYTLEYEALADGPPEPVSNLGVFGINETCGHLNFTTGYNYNRTQTFIINRYIDDKMTVLENCKDLTSGRGGDPFTCMVCKLVENSIYNVTVISYNSRGESQPKPVTFSTYGAPKPDPARTTNSTFKPRLDEPVVLSMHAVGYPVPEYQWFHNGVQVNSTDTGYTSEVHIENVAVKDFGKYVLNMTNEAGHFTTVYELLPDGPPASVTDLNLSAVTTSSANLSFITGYDYNKTQIFVVVRFQNGKMTELENVTDNFPDAGQKEFSIGVTTLASDAVYNVTVLSWNSNGTSLPSSSEFITFTAEGGPGPDPDHPINNTVSPRIGTDASFIVYAVGNPQPVFSWSHNNLPINHTDHGLTTMIKIHNVKVEDFGEYVLNMENKFGSWNNSYLLKEDGPPDAVKNLIFTDITSDSVVLSWDVGFNYGSKQSFDVKGTVNDKEYSNPNPIPDATGGKGAESFMLKNLESSASYNIYLVAKNQRGPAPKSNEISFATKAGPGKSPPAAEIVGYVIGGVVGVVLIIVIITVIRRYRRRREYTQYENGSDEVEEDARHQPHQFRYTHL